MALCELCRLFPLLLPGRFPQAQGLPQAQSHTMLIKTAVQEQSLQLFILCCSAQLAPVILFPGLTQHQLLAPGRLLHSAWLPFFVLQSGTSFQTAGTVKGLTTFVFYFSGMTVILISTVKILFHVFIQFLSYFRQDGKSSLSLYLHQKWKTNLFDCISLILC